MPVDAQGGEKLDLLTGMLGALVVDASTRGLLRDDFYYFDDRALATFKRLQGIEPDTPLGGSRLQQAYEIWSQTPREVLKAMLGAQGVQLPEHFVQHDRVQFFTSDESTDGRPDVMYVRYIPPTPFKNPGRRNEVGQE